MLKWLTIVLGFLTWWHRRTRDRQADLKAELNKYARRHGAESIDADNVTLGLREILLRHLTESTLRLEDLTARLVGLTVWLRWLTIALAFLTLVLAIGEVLRYFAGK